MALGKEGDSAAQRLRLAVRRFRRFQKRRYPWVTEDNDNGEWEIGLPLWDAMNRAYLAALEQTEPEQAGPETIDAMLYTIARDSECSYLMPDTLRRPDWFQVLCRASLSCPYPNAKWQFAQQLGGDGAPEQLRPLLFSLIESGDEYTERMALQSMARHFPRQAERYAVKFWNRTKYPADEYQKIMALWALRQIDSPLLADHIEKALQTDYPYLKQQAEQYRRQLGRPAPAE